LCKKSNLKYKIIVEEFIPFFYANQLDPLIKELVNINTKQSEPGTSTLRRTIVWWLKYFIPTSEFFNIKRIYIKTEENIIFSIQPMGFGFALIAFSAEPILYDEIGIEEVRLSKFLDKFTNNIKFEGKLRIYTKTLDKKLAKYIKKSLKKKGYRLKYKNNDLIIKDKKKNVLFTINKYWDFHAKGVNLEKEGEIEKACELLREILARKYLEDTAAWCTYDRRRLTIIYQKCQDFSKIDIEYLKKNLDEKKVMGSNIQINESNRNDDFLLFIPHKKYHEGVFQPRFLLITKSDQLNWIAISSVCYEWNLYYTKMRHYLIFEDYYNIFYELMNDPRKYNLQDITDFSDNLRRFKEELRIKDSVGAGKFMSYKPIDLTENNLEITELETITSLEFLRKHILPSKPGSITHDLSDKVLDMIKMMETFSTEMYNIYTNERNLQIQNELYIIQFLFAIILPTTIIQTFLPDLAVDRKIIFSIGGAILLSFIMYMVHKRFRKTNNF